MTSASGGQGPASPLRGDAGPAPILQITELSKSFANTRALVGASLSVASGEVHGLVGQNGSGKSTVVKVLSGYHEADSGEISVGGRNVTKMLAGAGSRHLGLRFVHQDLGLIGGLTVTENLFIEQYSSGDHRMLRWRAEHARARALLRSFGVDADPRQRVGDLPAALQAMVVIVRAAVGLLAGADDGDRRGVLVLDEATASLPPDARDQLRSVVRDVVALGHGVLFVSHFPDEVLDWADRVTVLRDGHVVADRATAGLTEDALIELIIGRQIEAADLTHEQRTGAGGEPALSVTGLRGREVAALDFEVQAGEALGITGLVGSGFDEVCRVLGGAVSAAEGTLQLAGDHWDLRTFTAAVARRVGVSLVPQDRQREGVAPALTVVENVSLSLLDRYETRGGRVRHRQLRREVERLLDEYDVVPPDPGARVRSLSGGNQQKVLIAKAMALRPKVLVLIEPTQGVDVGARREILKKLREVARAGTAVVCATNDASQLEELCDRVIVLRRGRFGAELTGEGLTEDRIVEETYRSVA